MDLTKYTHSCVVVDAGRGRVVLDPGVWAEPESLEAAEAVLITHEHPDHVDVERIGALVRRHDEVTVFAPRSVLALMPQLGEAGVAVTPGDRFEVAGMSVDVVGGSHAEVYAGLPGCANVGFVLDEVVYHPGDSFYVSEVPATTVLVPTSGPWLRMADAIGLLTQMRPARALPIHDGLLHPRGEPIVDRWLADHGGTDYRRLRVGESLTV